MSAATGLILFSRPSIAPVAATRPSFARPKNGFRAVAPNLPRAAWALAAAPSKDSPIFKALPPMPARIAFSKVSKSIFPLETISEISAEVFPVSLASNWSTGIPDAMSCNMSSPWSLPRAATEPKITPTSCMLRPAIAAVSPTVFRVVSSCWPGLMPAATRPAATDAASPRPNAVPFTEDKASFMTPATVLVSLPRPRSFCWAFSIAVRRPMPLAMAVPIRPPAATPVASAPAFSVLPTPAASLLPHEPPRRSASLSTPPSALAMVGLILLTSGMIEM